MGAGRDHSADSAGFCKPEGICSTPREARPNRLFKIFTQHKKASGRMQHLPQDSNLRLAKTSSYPDIIDYPGHDACVSCHRLQFFKGPRPVICSGCHTKRLLHVMKHDMLFGIRPRDFSL